MLRSDLLRQLIVSLIIVVACAFGWLFWAPGAAETLARAGIVLPFGPSVETADANARPGPGGPGGGRIGGPGRTTNVITTAVASATINDTLTAIGEGTPVRSVTITAATAGDLDEVLVRPGQVVERGAVIARFDDEAEQIELAGAELAVADAQATLTRTQSLASGSLVATTALSAAQLAADNAELERRNAQVALARRTVTSPISGTVGLIRVSAGNLVPAQTTITAIDDTSSILLDFWVPERYAAQLELGMRVNVAAVALTGQSFTGDVTAIDNRIDPASRTLQVQAEIPNPEGKLRAGMGLTVSMNFPGEEYPTVNPLAILWSAQGSYVWKYDNGTARRVMAEIVQRNSDGVLVRADLEPGDAIITEGILQLSDGAHVTLLDGPDGTGAAVASAPQS